MKDHNVNYQSFFRDELYGKFVMFLTHKLGRAKVIALIGDEPLFTKKGVHYQLRRLFNEFLSQNNSIAKVFIANGQKCIVLRNICDQPLRFPVDVNDDKLMNDLRLRQPATEKTKFEFERASKSDKLNVEPLKGQTLKGDWKEKLFIAPTKLIIHFKRAYANLIGKTTVVYDVHSKDEIVTFLFDTYKDKVAFAKVDNHKFEFVKRKNRKKYEIKEVS